MKKRRRAKRAKTIISSIVVSIGLNPDAVIRGLGELAKDIVRTRATNLFVAQERKMRERAGREADLEVREMVKKAEEMARKTIAEEARHKKSRPFRRPIQKELDEVLKRAHEQFAPKKGPKK